MADYIIYGNQVWLTSVYDQ